MSIFKSLMGSIVEPISSAYKSNQERKKSTETAKAKIKLAKDNQDFKLDLSQSEWQSLSKKAEDGTWKDEYITLVITSPFLLSFVAGVLSGWTGDLSYITAVNAGISALTSLGLHLGELTYIVVLAAVSIKGVRLLKG